MSEYLKLQYKGFCESPLYPLAQANIGNFTLEINNPLEVPTLVKLPTRLGKLAELFFLHYLNSHPDFEVIEYGIQLTEKGQTVGELDFLVRKLRTGEIFHIELAHKYYLYDPRIEQEKKGPWIGPNRNDLLNQKITHLVERQLPLLYLPSAKQKLHDLGLHPENITQYVCLQARLFIPPETTFANEAFGQCITGHWVPFDQFKPEETTMYFLPHKHLWMVNPEDWEKWLSWQTLEEQAIHWNQMTKSFMVWTKKENGTCGRIFLTHWH